jgi:UDP-galactopyranose mutase
VEEAGITDPQNLEEQAISLVGTDIYEKLIKAYTRETMGKESDGTASFHYQTAARPFHIRQ